MKTPNFILTLILSALLFASSCSSGKVEEQPKDSPAPSAVEHGIDHVIVAINDLDRGIAKFEELTGVKPVVGGEHPGRGTHNALVSVGDHTYLELIAPRKNLDPEERKLSENLLAYEDLTPIGWAVTTSDPERSKEIVSGLGFPVGPIRDGSRVKPDGTKLEWRTFAIREGFTIVPFFINWGASSPHPSGTSPKGAELTGFSIWSPEPDKLSSLVKKLGLDVSVEKGDERIRLELNSPKGKVVLPVEQ